MSQPPDESTTQSDAEGDALAPGTVVGDRYRVVARLGAGGMGTVYRAEHVALRNTVAIKVLHRFARADHELAARFEREALAAANIDHPNVVRAFDFGQLPDGTLYLAMEFVEGETLAQLLARTPRLPPARALKILRQIAAALGRAHAMGVVHRDVKPENIVLTRRDGEADFVKVVDFGIARVRSEALGAPGGTALTQAGMVFGTPAYLSPEQALGQPVDARADQYALGVVAFRMLAGVLPFTADDGLGLVQKHLMAEVPRVTAHAPELPPAVDAVVARMLAKRKADRFESIEAAVDALARALGQPGAGATASAAATTTSVGGAPTVLSAMTGAPTQFAPPGAPTHAPTAAAGPGGGAAWAPAATSAPGRSGTAPVPVAAPVATRPPTPLLAAVAALAGVVLLAAGAFVLLRSGGAASAPDAVAPSTSLGFDAGLAARPGGTPGAQPVAPLPAPGGPAAGTTARASRGPCQNGRCACSNRMRCSYACGDSPCDAVCDRVGDCTGECGARCAMRCTNGSRCNLQCEGDCNVACSNVRECRVQCGEQCRVDCSLMMNCAVRMVSGEVTCSERVGACNVTCALPDGQTAPATRCRRGHYRCPPGPC